MRRLFLAAVLAALNTMPTSAQRIDVPATVTIGEPIVARLAADIPEGAQVRGSWTVEADTYQPGAQSNTIHIWAASGEHTVKASGVWVLTKPVKVGDQTVPSISVPRLARMAGSPSIDIRWANACVLHSKRSGLNCASVCTDHLAKRLVGCGGLYRAG